MMFDTSHMEAINRVTQRLEKLNQQFYEHYAKQFDGTRMSAWAGWENIIKDLSRHYPHKVLDLGCGNGRLARVLKRTQMTDADLFIACYQGLDRCSPLLLAAQQHQTHDTLDFPCTWTEWNWGNLRDQIESLPTIKPQWSWITIFGVTHHIFSYERRLALLKTAAGLLEPGGRLSVSFWDFASSPRWAHKTVAWEHLASHWGEDLAYLEEGDYFLGWGGSQEVLRYCHWVSPKEEERLSTALCTDFKGLTALPTQHDPKGHNRYRCWINAS